MFSVSALLSGFDSREALGAEQWQRKEEVLTPSEVLEIVYNSDESLSDSSSDCVSSIDNETDDIAVADAIINDSEDEGEILHRFQVGDYGQLHRTERNFGHRNGAENVTLYNVSSYFLTKKS
jgi:hypothetical protein